MEEGGASGIPGGGFRLPRAARIAASTEIRTLQRRGKKTRTRHLDVWVASSPASFPRLGVIVPKHRHRIVERNRLKRRLRDAGRRILLPALRGAKLPLDVLVRARSEAYDAGWEALRAEVQALAEGLCSRAR